MILYISILTIVFCLILFLFNSKINSTINYLIWFLLPVSIYGIYHHLLFFNDSAFLLSILNVQSLPLYYMAPPMLYFYVRNTLEDKNIISKVDSIHFVPTLIGFISVLPYIFSDSVYKIQISQQFIDNISSIKTAHTHWFYPNYVNVILRPAQLLVYSLSCIYLIWKYSLNAQKYSPPHQKKLLLRWLTSISLLAFLVGASYAAMTFIFFSVKDIDRPEFNQLNISLIAGILYSLIPLIIFIFPGILYGIPKVERKQKNAIKTKNKLSISVHQINPSHPFEETTKIILDYLENSKPYLNPKFKIDDLVTELQIPKHHIYYCFNYLIKDKFTTIRNNYRVTYAKNALLSDQLKVMTVEAIGLTSGFASKSNFFAIFKEVTGMTPYEFVKQNNSNSIS